MGPVRVRVMVSVRSRVRSRGRIRAWGRVAQHRGLVLVDVRVRVTVTVTVRVRVRVSQYGGIVLVNLVDIRHKLHALVAWQGSGPVVRVYDP